MRCSRPMVASAMSLCAVGFPVQAQPLAYQRIWLTNDAVPALGPGVFGLGYSQAPVLNAAGMVGFLGTLQGSGVSGQNNSAIFTASPGVVTPSLRTGSQVPGTNQGVVSTALSNLRLGDSGTVLVQSLMAGPGISTTNDTANLGGSGSSLSIVAQSGTTPPGSPVPFVSFNRGLVNAAGQFGIVADTSVDHNSHGFWIASSGQAPQLVVRTGSPAPDLPGWSFGTVWTPSLSDGGQMAFLGVVTNTAQSRVGLYVGTTSGTGLIADTTTSVPGAAGAVFSEFAASPSTNRSGEMAFVARYQQGSVTRPGVFKVSNGAVLGVQPVALGDSNLPGTPVGSTLRFTSNVTISSAGSVAFAAQLFTSGTITPDNDEGLWIQRSGTLATIVREGQAAPGVPTGVSIGSSDSYSLLNANDQMVFAVDLFGPSVTSTNDRALYFWDPAGGLTLLARKGDLFSVGPADSRVIRFVDFISSQQAASTYMGPGGTGGTPSGLNDSGLVTFGLRFTDNTSGIFTVQVPAPGALVAFPIIAGMVGRRRRRKS